MKVTKKPKKPSKNRYLYEQNEAPEHKQFAPSFESGKKGFFLQAIISCRRIGYEKSQIDQKCNN